MLFLFTYLLGSHIFPAPTVGFQRTVSYFWTGQWAHPAAAAAAKSPQSCLTLQPHRRQPTRLPRSWDSPGKNTGVGCHFLLQRMKGKVKVKLLSRVRLLATPWTTVYWAPPSMGFSRQEYWSGVPLPSPDHILENKIQQSFWNARDTRENVWNTTYHNLSCIGPSLVVWNYM